VKPLVFFILLTSTLFSTDLQQEYFIESREFNASSVFPQIKDDFIIYRFDENQHQKAFTSAKLVKRFQQKGIELKAEKSSIVHVQRMSTVNLDPIIKKIKSYYHSYHPNITIREVLLKSNGFIKELPERYRVTFKPSAYLYHRSTLQVASEDATQRYFLRYELRATIKLFKAKHNINRGKILTQVDLSYKDEAFKRLNSLPLRHLDGGKFRLKKRLAKGKILYKRDIQPLPYVLKGKSVNVRLISGSVHLEFQATALEDGQKNEYVFIKKTDGKKLKAKVISRNLVEIE